MMEMQHILKVLLMLLASVGSGWTQGTPEPYPDCLDINNFTPIPPDAYGGTNGFPIASVHSSCEAYCRDTDNMAYYGVMRNGPGNYSRCSCDYRLDDVDNIGSCSYRCNGQPCGRPNGWISIFTTCDIGKYSPDCSLSCPGYCYYGVCDLLTGNCDNGCQEGWHGAQCDTQCPVNCDGGCHQSDGGCVACKPGFYGYYCDITNTPLPYPDCLLDATFTAIPGDAIPVASVHAVCLDYCRDTSNTAYYGVKRHGPRGAKARCYCDYRLDDVENTGACDYRCGGQPCGGTANIAIWMSVVTTCDIGKYSPDCSLSCPGYCYYGVCDLLTGNCDNGCQEGWYSADCTQGCFNCAGGCNQTGNGECLSGCKAGWHGALCDQRCPHNCQDDTCSQQGAVCSLGCDLGFWGDFCNMTCDNCANGCLQDGSCLPGGCLDGWYGPFCNNSCPLQCLNDVCEQVNGICLSCDVNYWSNFCNKTCDNCAGGCQQNGTCLPGGCLDGWFGNMCEIPCPDCGGDTKCLDDRCHQNNGTCDACEAGRYGTNCCDSCSAGCAALCDQWTGQCSGCTNGRHGPFCNLSCSATCLNDICDQYTAECSDGCEEGFWGPTCGQQCPDNCSAQCDRLTGECSSCVDGQFGIYCNLTCPDNCSADCDRLTGECSSCLDGQFGVYCNLTCADTCLNDFCEQNTGHCTGCTPGYYGDFCDIDCSANCETCDQMSGFCDSCKLGFWSVFCNKTCNHNCDYGCEQTSGICSCCSNGYFGDFCENSCPPLCLNSTCDQSLGHCLYGCQVDYWGDVCNRSCHQNCKDGCHIESGDCIHGCDPGWFNITCDTACPGNCKGDICDQVSGACPGDCENDYYLVFCNETCPTNCFEKCQKSDGHCIYGCDDGYHGSVCDESCRAECGDPYCHNVTGDCFSCQGSLFGEKCDQQCPVNCTDDVCMFSGGDCHRGCKTGTHGMKCDEMCPVNCLNDECYQETGMCTQGCDDGFTGGVCEESVSSTNLGIIVGCVIGGVVLIVVIILGVIFGRRHKKTEENKTSRSSAIQRGIQNKHSNREHSYVNACIETTFSEHADRANATVFKAADFLRFWEVKMLEKHPFRKEYQLLDQLRVHITETDLEISLHADNIHLNRDINILPLLSRRVVLPVSPAHPTDYINAVRVDGLSEKDAYFVTELPPPDTVHRFWTMVTDYNSTAIIMILQQKHLMDHTRFLPPEFKANLYENIECITRSGLTQYRSVDIDKESVIETRIQQDESGYSHLNILEEPIVEKLQEENGYTKLFHQKEQQQKDAIRLFEVVLPDGVQCLDSSTILSVYQDVVKWQQQQWGSAPVVVTCLDGAKHSGQYVACSNLFKMISQKQEVDVFSVAKAVRESRPQFIGTYEEYENLYRAAGHYISQHTTYMEINV